MLKCAPELRLGRDRTKLSLTRLKSQVALTDTHRVRLCELVSHTVSRFRGHHPFHTRSALAMGLRYVFHPSRSRHTPPDRAEGRMSEVHGMGG